MAIALTADLRIAADDARLAIPAARLGLGYHASGVAAIFGPGTNVPKAARRVLELVNQSLQGGRPGTAAVGA